MCNTSKPTKFQTVKFDFGRGELLRNPHNIRNTFSLFHSLSPSAREETEAQKLFFKCASNPPSSISRQQQAVFQVLYYFKYFPHVI